MAELVGLNAQVPDILPKLSQLLAIQKQQTELAGAQQSLRQRQALAAFDYNQILGEDGTFDLQKIPLVREAAGDLYPEIARHLVDAKSAQIDAKSKLLNLNTEQLNTYRSLVGGLLQDRDVIEDNEKGRQKANDVYIHFGETYGPDALPVIEAYAQRLQKVPKGKLKDTIVSYQMQANDAGRQLEAQRPQYLSTGGEFQQINPLSPGASPAAPMIPATIAPGFAVVTDPRTQNPYLLNQQTGEMRDLGYGFPGKSPTNRGPSPSASPAAPPASMPQPFKPGEAITTADQAEKVSARVAGALEQATATPQAIDALSRARHILDSADLSTGANFQHFTGLKNIFAGWGFDAGTDANSLVKNLARYQASRATAAGLGGTDAARELAEKGSPNTKIDSKALKGVVTQSLATEMALAAYAKIQAGVTDPAEMARKEREFHSVPNLITTYEYGLMRSPEEAAEFRKKHGLSKDALAKSVEQLRKLGAL